LLKQNHVEFSDLGETALEDFQGKLAIIGPFSTKAQMREGWRRRFRKLARRVRPWYGSAAAGTKDPIKPSFYIVPEGKGSISWWFRRIWSPGCPKIPSPSSKPGILL